jgi:hypothetical protein
MTPPNYPVEELDPDYDDGTMPDNVATLADVVVGHRIVSAEKKTVPNGNYWGRQEATVITLDNGKKVLLRDTDDCCAYTSLEKFLLHPENIDHIIMGVGTTDGYSKWHIYADFGDIMEMEVGWSSGNPFYYGYGFDIEVVDGDLPDA